MLDRWRGIAGAAALGIGLGACIRPGGTIHAGSDPGEARGPTPSAVLGREVLADESGMLIEVMRRRIPALRVRSTERCPAISLRGPNTMPGVTEPTIYIDGVRALDTCVLSTLPVVDIRRVEVYAQGVTGRPGYGISPHGLILVFRHDR